MATSNRPLRLISLWWVAAGVMAVGAGIWVSTWWLLAQTHGLQGAVAVSARMDAIKTGLSVGAGSGGAVALMLALRRQWLNERDFAHRQETDRQGQLLSERAAVAAEHDATERRITDLYVKAVDQLGSERAPVRLGAMHALGRLGQANPGLRQTVTEVICAYLRIPFDWPTESSQHGSARHPTSKEELQVRLTAQRVLAEHLRRASGDDSIPDAFWPEIDLIDLSGAHLIDINLSRCRVKTVQCNHATFSGESLFRELSCDLAFVQNAVFDGFADFRGAVFGLHAWFSGTTFAGNVWYHADRFFPGARFGRHASFANVSFARAARFGGAVFEGSADFGKLTCKEGPESIQLEDAQVQDPDAVSPDVKREPSNWPPGWVVETGGNEAAIVTWRG